MKVHFVVLPAPSSYFCYLTLPSVVRAVTATKLHRVTKTCHGPDSINEAPRTQLWLLYPVRSSL